jgi:hypothetical protein
MRFGVLTMVYLRIQVFWDVTQCHGLVVPSLLEDYIALIFKGPSSAEGEGTVFGHSGNYSPTHHHIHDMHPQDLSM